MLGIDAATYPLWANLAIFAFTAVLIWLAGSRLTVYADIIADRSGLGQAFVGLVFLAIATSLPEIGRTIGAAIIGNVLLAVDSLFGGIVLQTAILAAADLVIARRALTYFAPRPVLLLQGVVVVLLLSLAIVGMATGEVVRLVWVGLLSTTIALFYLFALYLLKSYETREQWRPVSLPEELPPQMPAVAGGIVRYSGTSLSRVVLLFLFSSIVIFAAGLTLADVGDALAAQTGLSAGFIGATLLAFASSLPELSTTVAAVRIGAYSLAVSNIFGTNAFLVALLFVADVFYRQDAILASAGNSAEFAAAVGIITTSIYLAGMIERRNVVVLGMGIDSLIVVIVFLLSLPVLYLLR